jgi:hypothetical protein
MQKRQGIPQKIKAEGSAHLYIAFLRQRWRKPQEQEQKGETPMAIYHLSAKIISRSKGRTATASAAYRAGERIVDERTGLVFDYRKKRGVSLRTIYAPANAPQWATDRSRLWNEAEKEKRKDAQVAREIAIALPRLLSERDRTVLLEHFVNSQFVRRGMVADVCVHENKNNPHAHIMLTTRSIGPDGFGAKNRDWNTKGQLEVWREQWAKRANLRLEAAGHDARIDHRTLAEQGIDRAPTVHLGPAKKAMLERAARTKPVPMPTTPNRIHNQEKTMNHAIQGMMALPLNAIAQDSSTGQDDDFTYEMLIAMLFGPEYAAMISGKWQWFLVAMMVERHKDGPRIKFETQKGTVYDYGNRIACEGGGNGEIDLLLDLAKAKGWNGVHLSGSEDFKQRSFIRAVASGLFTPEQITGFVPSPELLAKVKQEVDELANAQEATAPSPAPTLSPASAPESGDIAADFDDGVDKETTMQRIKRLREEAEARNKKHTSTYRP